MNDDVPVVLPVVTATANTNRLRRTNNILPVAAVTGGAATTTSSSRTTTVTATKGAAHSTRRTTLLRYTNINNNKNNNRYVRTFMSELVIRATRWIGPIFVAMMMAMVVTTVVIYSILLRQPTSSTSSTTTTFPFQTVVVPVDPTKLQLPKNYQWEVCDPLRTSTSTSSTRTTRIDELCHYNPWSSEQQQQHNATEDVSSTLYMFYNPLPKMTRYLYSHHNISIPPKSNVTLTAISLLSSSNRLPVTTTNLFRIPPIDVTITNQNDISTISTNQIPVETRFSFDRPTHVFNDCDIPCLYDVDDPISDRYINVIDHTTTWLISFSMEGPQYWESIYIQPTAWRDNHFWSTTSYHSEIPLPYYDNITFHIWHTNFVPYNTGIKGAVFLANNCNSKNNREQIVQEMIRMTNISSSSSSNFRIDSISSCLHNAEPPDGMSLENKGTLMQQYLFYLAFENQCENDYITEKLWGPLEAGTIPVYYGAPNVKDHVPYHSIIHVNDYNTTQDLMNHLIEVSNNRELYESYHDWRFQPIPDHFRIKYDFTTIHSTCRTCRWAYSRMYGVGWNHTTQSLRPLRIGSSRLACLSTPMTSFTSSRNSHNIHQSLINYLVQHPFVEEWYSSDGKRLSTKPIIVSTTMENDVMTSTTITNSSIRTGCQHPLTDENREIDIDDGMIQRTVYNNDGVIDFLIRKGPTYDRNSDDRDPSSLRLRIPLLSPPIMLRNVRPGVWFIQNDQSRYTILLATSFAPSVDTVVTRTTNEDNVFTINIVSPIRLRVIVEDVDDFHEGARDVENFFGKLMADDFFNPVQVSIRVPID